MVQGPKEGWTHRSQDLMARLPHLADVPPMSKTSLTTPGCLVGLELPKIDK